ncbi:hypothetical protein [Paenibacillus sp.]|uniref:hypothetical protein n=1 Tax=Paenibacillus sp. TaxID=58172 RepID=UPI0028118AD5|nr:hypothetical protein [Paenibacillus sp.]
MRKLQAIMLWWMDVMVAVFIGPVERGKRAWKVREMASRRGVYALGFAGVVVAAAALYTIIIRWSAPGSY